MQTVVIVGNSQTFRYGDYLITPRGYLAKYQVAGPDADASLVGSHPHVPPETME